MEKKKINSTEYFGKLDLYRLHPKLKGLLKECKAVESSKYDIDMVKVEKERLVVTDGRRMLILDFTHEIKPGLYYLSGEGFLLPYKGKKQEYPKYNDVIPKVDEKDMFVLGDSSYVFSKALKEASKSVMLDVGMYADFVRQINKLGPNEIGYHVEPEKCIYIMGSLEDTEDAVFRYVQMYVQDTEEE